MRKKKKQDGLRVKEASSERMGMASKARRHLSGRVNDEKEVTR